MSIGATNAVWKRSGQKSGPLLVLLALADYTNSQGIAWPAISTLARKVRMSKRNAQRCVRALEEAGELEVRRNQGRRGSNIYRILLSNTESNDTDVRVMGGGGGAKAVSSASSTGDVSVAQSVSKPLKESTPVVPKGDDTDFWIKICFRCFEQPVHDIPAHVLRELSAAIPTLNKDDADSLIDFYQTEPLLSKEPPYTRSTVRFWQKASPTDERARDRSPLIKFVNTRTDGRLLISSRRKEVIRSRSHDAVIRVYDSVGDVIETHGRSTCGTSWKLIVLHQILKEWREHYKPGLPRAAWKGLLPVT